MGRMRTIKPSFFTNETLGSLDPFARLLFIGLWTVADREGRLEDRPRRIKAELFPYDPEVDVDALLDELAGAGFISRYEVVASGRLIQIRAFARHQRPHSREAASELPGPRKVEHDLGSASASPGQTQAIMPFDLGAPAVRVLDRPGEQAGDPLHGLGEQAGEPLHHGILDPCNEIRDQRSGEGEGDPVAPPADAGEAPADHGAALGRLSNAWARAAGAPCTPMVKDMLSEELRLGTPAPWVEEAIVEAGVNGAVRWRYVERVLERFKRSRPLPGEPAADFYRRTLLGPHYGPSEAAS